jgi:hypothetical protein
LLKAQASLGVRRVDGIDHIAAIAEMLAGTAVQWMEKVTNEQYSGIE